MATRQGARGAAKTQIRARITYVGSEYRKDVTSDTRKLCITDWAARSSPSASSRPSKPASAPPKGTVVSVEKGAKSEARKRRESITQTRTRQPDACYASHCFFRVLLSVGTFCVNGRAHATARRRFLSHFPGDHEHAWARSRKTEPRPRRYERGRGSARQMPPLTRRGRRSGSASANRHRQSAQQAQHAGASEDASHVGTRASQLLRRGSRRSGRRGRGSGRARR